MRLVSALLALSALLFFRPSLAEEDVGSRLLGSWRLLSQTVQFVGENAAPRDIYGSHPFGRLILTPEHTMAAYLSAPDRKPPTNDAEAAALLRSTAAYTGKFRVERDKFITTVDGAWTEVFKATEQVRYFTVDGDKLTVRTPEQPYGLQPDKRFVGVAIWEREK